MSEQHRCIFSGMQIFIEEKWINDHAVIVEGQMITAIIPINMVKHHLPAQQFHYPQDHYLIPGLIDLHIHGAHGYDVMDGSEEALITIARALAAEGVTGYLATTMTAESRRIEEVLRVIASMRSHAEGASILGVHLEGPFIAKDKVGAQRKEFVRDPDPSLMQHWQACAQGAIKCVTLAPELPNAQALINLLRKMQVIASIGHTNATYAETRAAIEAGGMQATHLFNAMRPVHQREPGAAVALLLANEVTAELIVDDFHLHPAVVELAWRLKGKDKLLLVTDAMRAKCLGDGQYELGGQSVSVNKDKAVLKDGTLAGSTLRMPQALKNVRQFSHCSLIEAICMASTNPARVLGLGARKGEIAMGKDADLVVMSAQLDVALTMREGRVVFRQ